MLRYGRQIKPGLVALYDIRPGNRAGLFLQPRSPHGAHNSYKWQLNCNINHSITDTAAAVINCDRRT